MRRRVADSPARSRTSTRRRSRGWCFSLEERTTRAGTPLRWLRAQPRQPATLDALQAPMSVSGALGWPAAERRSTRSTYGCGLVDPASRYCSMNPQ